MKKVNFQIALIIFVFSLFLTTYSGWQVSPITFKEFDHICQSFSYNDCMVFYWNQKSYYRTFFYPAAFITVISGITTAILFLKSKKITKTKNV